MEFSKLLKKSDPFKGTDGFAVVNGKPTNAVICEEMLGEDQQDPETCAQMVEDAIARGISPEDANTFWGYKTP